MLKSGHAGRTVRTRTGTPGTAGTRTRAVSGTNDANDANGVASLVRRSCQFHISVRLDQLITLAAVERGWTRSAVVERALEAWLPRTLPVPVPVPVPIPRHAPIPTPGWGGTV